MDGYQLIAAIIDSISKIAWPLAVATCVWLLRVEIRNLLPHTYVKHGEFEMGFNVGQNIALKQISTPLTPLNSSTKNLGKLTNSEIKEHACAITKELRDFQNKIRSRDTYTFNLSNQDWDRYVKNLEKKANKDLHEWRSKFQPDAVAIKNELLRRIGTDHGIDLSHAQAALDFGMLAGPSPVNDAALAIEELCRALPD